MLFFYICLIQGLASRPENIYLNPAGGIEHMTERKFVRKESREEDDCNSKRPHEFPPQYIGTDFHSTFIYPRSRIKPMAQILEDVVVCSIWTVNNLLPKVALSCTTSRRSQSSCAESRGWSSNAVSCGFLETLSTNHIDFVR